MVVIVDENARNIWYYDAREDEFKLTDAVGKTWASAIIEQAGIPEYSTQSESVRLSSINKEMISWRLQPAV